MINKLKLVRIDYNYCDYLRKYDNRVSYNAGRKELRPFVGVLFEINNCEYFAPLSSPKEKHLKLKNNIDLLKINEGKQGVINFNNMIPVMVDNYMMVDLGAKVSSKEENNYIELLKDQYTWINEHVDEIIKKAKNLYEKYTKNKLPENIKNRCCNFLFLEEKCCDYNRKYLKVIFNDGTYKIEDVNVSDNWDPYGQDGREIGGFNFSTNDKILRWLIRGDTLVDVEIPSDAEVIDCESKSTPHGVFRTNKIILSNPRTITDDIAMEIYKASNIPTNSYYKALAGLMIRGYKETSLQLIRDKISTNNIKLCLSEIEDFVKPEEATGYDNSSVYYEIKEILDEINNPLLISINVNKGPYIKNITSDNIINITGESGSGKSTYVEKHFSKDKYIIIDTDDMRKNNNNQYIIKLNKYLKEKYNENIPDIITSFGTIYQDILDCFKDFEETLIIDSAQFRNIKDLSILKGKMIIMRTCIDKCYQRCINRYINNHIGLSKEELQKYQNKKMGMYNWYKSLNDFILKLDNSD